MKKTETRREAVITEKMITDIAAMVGDSIDMGSDWTVYDIRADITEWREEGEDENAALLTDKQIVDLVDYIVCDLEERGYLMTDDGKIQ